MPVLTREEIERLSPTERLELIGQLTDSLDEAHVPLNAAQQAELDRRMETFDEGGCGVSALITERWHAAVV